MQSRSQLFPLLDQLAGRACALLFAFACLLLVAYAIANGAQWAATILGGAMIVAGINAFIRRASDDRGAKTTDKKQT
jgi:hypothetical protein